VINAPTPTCTAEAPSPSGTSADIRQVDGTANVTMTVLTVEQNPASVGGAATSRLSAGHSRRALFPARPGGR
jgi:hypothetical protein